MKIIKKGRHKLLFDSEDFHLIKDLQFFIDKIRGKYYVRYKNSVGKRCSLAYLILNFPKSRIKTKDGNTLNFQKTNLELKNLNKKALKQRWYQQNKKRVYQNTRKWQALNPDKLREIRIKYEKSSKGKATRIEKLKRLPSRYKRFIRTSQERYLKVVNIGFDKWCKLIKQNCYYCEKSLLTETGNSLDRIDNNKGYLLNNVLPCCGICNRTRHTAWTVEETKIMIDAVMKFRENKEKV